MRRVRRRIQLTVHDLRVQRSDTFALSIPFLNFQPGQVTCVVGSNGSGKTTLMETVVGLIVPNEGVVQVRGEAAHSDSLDVKRSIGFIPDNDMWIIPELTAREYFELLASVYVEQTSLWLMRRRYSELADELLFTAFDQLLGSLSHGNKKKVQIIAGLLHDPQFIVVDELRNGLDPIAITRAEQLLRRKQVSGAAIVAATHDLWWAERVADEIVMIKRGHIVLNDLKQHIVERFGSVEASFMEHYA